MATIYQQGRYVACVEPSMIVRSFSERCVKMNMTTCICHFFQCNLSRNLVYYVGATKHLAICNLLYLQGSQFM